jgi:ubiquinol-cytochrome c reductase cytochrome b subunit
MTQNDIPKTRVQRFRGWLETRTGLNLLLSVSLDEPIPGGARWAYVFGSGLLFIFISQVITGLCLALYYVPSAQNAHVTVAYITKRVAAGEFLRSLHVYGASAMIIVLALHFLQTFLWGAYKGRRELLWIAGGVLAVLVLAMGFTGYLLPWDQKAYFATAVATNIISTIPLIGPWTSHLMRGGETIGTLTLSRFYLAHVIIIPGLIFAFIAVHIYLFRKAGAAGPIKEDPVHPTLPPESFYPKQVLMDLAFSLLLVAGLGLLSYFRPVTLGPRANPASTTFIARPEWYYLSAFEWLKFWEGPTTVIGVVIIPGILALLFFLLPFLDRKLERRPWRRPIPLLAVSIVFGGLIFLGFRSHYQDMASPTVRRQLASQAAQEEAYTKAPFEPFVQAPGALDLLAPATYNPDVARGKALFQQNGCSGCHGDRGRGAVGPSLVGIGNKFSDTQLTGIIHDPPAAMLKAGMPGAPSLPIPEVKQLIDYLKALGTPEENVQPALNAAPAPTPAAANTPLSGSAAPPPNASQRAAGAGTSAPTASQAAVPGGNAALIAQGQQIFQQHACLACHGPTAQGTPVAPPLAGIGHYLPESTFSALIHHPNAPMRAKGMPPAPLSPQQTHQLWAYLNSMPAPMHRAPGVPPVVIFTVAKPALSHPAAPAREPAHHAATPAASPAPLPASPAKAAVVPGPRPPAMQTAAPTANSQTAAGNPTAGRAVFEEHACMACHGPTAQGTRLAPPLAGIGHYLSESTFNSLIHHPNAAMTAKGMPPAPISQQQTHNLWAYLNSMPVPAHRAPGVPAVVIFTVPKSASAQTSQPQPSAQAPNTAPASAPARVRPVAEPTLSGPALQGEHIFVSHGCIACHGVDGVGTRLAISLIGVTHKFSHQQLMNLIRHPNAKMKAGGMPTFTFTDSQLSNLLAYLAQLHPVKAAARNAATAAHHLPPHKLTPEEVAGQRVYFRARCSTCHGDGGMAGTAAAPSLTATASELPPDMLKHLLEHPSSAMQSHGMPPVSLSQSDLKALIAYIRALRYNR